MAEVNLVAQPTDEELKQTLFGTANEYLASRPGLKKRAAKLGAVQTAEWAVEAATYEVESAVQRAKDMLSRPVGSVYSPSR